MNPSGDPGGPGGGGSPGDGLPGGLLGLATALVAIPSVSHHEGPMADAVEAALRLCPWLVVDRVGDNVVARTDLGREHRVILAGHLDTVPPVDGNEEPRVEDGVLHGVGSADMKGGLAVFLHLAGRFPDPAVDLTYCFYVAEEVASEFSGLRHLFAERPDLVVGDVAILGEATSAVVEAGCQGSLRFRLELHGRRAHVARPAEGRNAIHRLAPLLQAIATWDSRVVDLDACRYVEQLQVVGIDGGVAGNVVPDHAALVVNHRFAPDRTTAEAESVLREMFAPHLEPGDTFEVTDAAPAAPPGLGHPLLAGLVVATGAAPRAKVGWTDVATFAAHGIPAANFGPGDPLLAHTPEEHVSEAALVRTAEILGRFLVDAR